MQPTAEGARGPARSRRSRRRYQGPARLDRPRGCEALLYTDGATRGNPGPAAADFRILGPSGELLFEHEEALGERTNNQVEYAALALGLEASQAYTKGRVTVGSDSCGREA